MSRQQCQAAGTGAEGYCSLEARSNVTFVFLRRAATGLNRMDNTAERTRAGGDAA